MLPTLRETRHESLWSLGSDSVMTNKFSLPSSSLSNINSSQKSLKSQATTGSSGTKNKDGCFLQFAPSIDGHSSWKKLGGRKTPSSCVSSSKGESDRNLLYIPTRKRLVRVESFRKQWQENYSNAKNKRGHSSLIDLSKKEQPTTTDATPVPKIKANGRNGGMGGRSGSMPKLFPFLGGRTEDKAEPWKSRRVKKPTTTPNDKIPSTAPTQVAKINEDSQEERSLLKVEDRRDAFKKSRSSTNNNHQNNKFNRTDGGKSQFFGRRGSFAIRRKKASPFSDDTNSVTSDGSLQSPKKQLSLFLNHRRRMRRMGARQKNHHGSDEEIIGLTQRGSCDGGEEESHVLMWTSLRDDFKRSSGSSSSSKNNNERRNHAKSGSRMTTTSMRSMARSGSSVNLSPRPSRSAEHRLKKQSRR